MDLYMHGSIVNATDRRIQFKDETIYQVIFECDDEGDLHSPFRGKRGQSELEQRTKSLELELALKKKSLELEERQKLMLVLKLSLEL